MKLRLKRWTEHSYLHVRVWHFLTSLRLPTVKSGILYVNPVAFNLELSRAKFLLYKSSYENYQQQKKISQKQMLQFYDLKYKYMYPNSMIVLPIMSDNKKSV